LIHGIIVGHQDIGDAFLRALNSISGSIEHISFISNNGLSTRDIVKKIKDTGNGCKDDGIIIFVDIFGGSCWRAAKLAQLSQCHILTGLNLPMLLSFINKRNSFSFVELPSVLELDGKRGITSE
jgi:mannose/fructose-specific phosphotransferase system component IIA